LYLVLISLNQNLNLVLDLKPILIHILLCIPLIATSQIVKDTAFELISDKKIAKVQQQFDAVSTSIQKESIKTLRELQQIESKLRAKLSKTDIAKAVELFGESQQKYQELYNKILGGSPANSKFPLKEYIPGIDNMQTAIGFLQQNGSRLPPATLDKLQQAEASLLQLQVNLQNGNDVQSFITARQKFLQEQLSNFPVAKELLSFNKASYYYSAQLKQYKLAVHDPNKLENLILQNAGKLPGFQAFVQKHSYLSTLFGSPADNGNITTAAAPGLQTRSQVMAIVTQRVGSLGNNINPTGYIQQQFDNAQSQLSQLKNKVNLLMQKLSPGQSSDGDMAMPNFTPNGQKTKPFLKRLTYGFDMQSEKSANMLPAITDIGLTIGYKLNDKMTVGTGVVYKLGLGNGLSHIRLSNQGIGLRSYLDIKLKGTFFLTGGYEYNYFSTFASLHDIGNFKVDAWQKSALIGITKAYKVGKKTNKLQLLFDLRSNQEVPRGQALKFRIGSSF